jgi:hypothetical protein
MLARHPCLEAMSRARLVLLLLATLGGFAVGSACGAPHDPCAGGSCGCVGGDFCRLECEVSPCEIECGELSSCEASCNDDCHATCRDLSDCALDCDEDCTLECDRLSNCDAACGPRCDYTCRDVSNCTVAVGPDSVVSCARVSNCGVECHGACTVACENVGNCDVRCLDLQGNDIGSPAQEASGALVCG